MKRKTRFLLQRYNNLDAMKAAEYEYWRGGSACERLNAVADITAAAYGVKGELHHDGQLRKTIVRLKR